MTNILIFIISIMIYILPIYFIYKLYNKIKNYLKQYKNTTIENINTVVKIEKMNYIYKKNPMTEAEKNFIKMIKPLTDKENLIILTQIPLSAIFKGKTINQQNKINRKTIDFAIVDNNYNYKGFIELDDISHQREDRIKRDIFVNNLFNTYEIYLKRIKTSYNYDLEDIYSFIKKIKNKEQE